MPVDKTTLCLNKQEVYGEHRKFYGLESFINWRRVKAAERTLNEISRTNKNPRVLELGCGYKGANLFYLSKKFPGANFTGIDLRIDENSNRGRINLVSGDMASWKPEERYDCILSLAVAEHMVDLPGYFNLIHESLKDGGLAVLTTPKPQAHFILRLMAALRIFDPASISDHKLYLTRFGIEKLAEKASLKILSYDSILYLNQTCTLSRV